MNNTTFERHFSVGELALQWHLNRETVRQLIQHEPGVVRVRRGLKKVRTHYSVPESVAHRIHNKLDDPATDFLAKPPDKPSTAGHSRADSPLDAQGIGPSIVIR